MQIKKLILPSLIIGTSLGVTSSIAVKKRRGEKATQHPSYEAIDAYIEAHVHNMRIPGVSLAIVEGDQITHLRGFGRARPGGEVPSPQTPFFIGSVTKSFTALAIIQLVEAGKVDLDAPVQRYLPWFRVADLDASARMTVRHLLYHTSGIPMSSGEITLSDFDDQLDATERQVRALSSARLASPPGSRFDYNNTNYNILGLIITSTSGESYPAYVQDHIFNPLDMRHSYTSKEAALQHGLAMGYRYWFGFPIPAPDLSIPVGSLPSGQIISCAEDMAHYLVAQINAGRYGDTQILSASGIEAMHRSATDIFVMGRNVGTYAMGWESSISGNTRIIWHSGIVPDFGAYAGFVPDQKKGLILLFNTNHAIMKLSFDEFGMGAMERLAGETPSKTIFSAAPWVMRGMPLIPVIQLAGVALTLRQLARWRSNPESRPSTSRLWGQHILLPLIPNIIATLMLIPVVGKTRGWMELFMPDYTWLARICGGFAALWAFLRTALILRVVRKPRP